MDEPASIVIDVGAFHHPPEESTEALIRRYEPKLVLAFDPFPRFKEGIESREFCTIVRRRAAVWIHSNGVKYWQHGMDGGVRRDGVATETVPSVNLLPLILAFPKDSVILKMDCEGAEYVILPLLRKKALDLRLAMAIIEWHPQVTANGWFLPKEKRPQLRCPVYDWENDFQLR